MVTITCPSSREVLSPGATRTHALVRSFVRACVRELLIELNFIFGVRLSWPFDADNDTAIDTAIEPPYPYFPSFPFCRVRPRISPRFELYGNWLARGRPLVLCFMTSTGVSLSCSRLASVFHVLGVNEARTTGEGNPYRHFDHHLDGLKSKAPPPVSLGKRTLWEPEPESDSKPASGRGLI